MYERYKRDYGGKFHFNVSFVGATYDGSETTFEYCITGKDVPDFHALSNWLLELNTRCISSQDIGTCSPAPCFYQVNDPNLGLTGIKFDDTSVEIGETKCYSFELGGDWTNDLGDVALGLKASNEIAISNICGPICRVCGITLAVITDESGAAPTYSATIEHNRPKTVSRILTYKIRDANNVVVHSWKDGPITFALGTVYTKNEPIPNWPGLSPGEYTFSVSLKTNDMTGWSTQSTKFEILTTP